MVAKHALKNPKIPMPYLPINFGVYPYPSLKEECPFHLRINKGFLGGDLMFLGKKPNKLLVFLIIQINHSLPKMEFRLTTSFYKRASPIESLCYTFWQEGKKIGSESLI